MSEKDDQTEKDSGSITENKWLRVGVNLVAVTLLLVVVFLGWQRLQKGEQKNLASAQAAQEKGLPSNPLDQTPSPAPGEYQTPTVGPESTSSAGVSRRLMLKTTMKDRPREEVITYTVKTGDNLFSIAEIYGLKPETLLWGNYETLKDNPEVLQVDQVLNVLPIDGTYYKWTEGDNLSKVADFFKVKPEDIMGYPGNHLDLTVSVTNTTVIKPGTWLIVPGGKRPLKDWGPPAISRSNPAVARYYGPGSCGAIYEGAIGTGAFVWPTTAHFLSGYHFTGIHPAIDIGGALGNAIYAADSGVIVYAGWSNYGYGNLLVIDHGNGWQTAYAHLSVIKVSCGQSVTRGSMIAAMGSTGNSSGPHLHFEMSINGVKVNAMDYVK
jgi:murein DD-endopeptidase MepM/ murein hydrolase activator NlpD